MMVSGTDGEITSSKIDPCGVCGKRVGSNYGAPCVKLRNIKFCIIFLVDFG